MEELMRIRKTANIITVLLVVLCNRANVKFIGLLKKCLLTLSVYSSFKKRMSCLLAQLYSKKPCNETNNMINIRFGLMAL